MRLHLLLVALLIASAMAGCTSKSDSGSETGTDDETEGTQDTNDTIDPPEPIPDPVWQIAWSPAEPIEGEVVSFRVAGDPVEAYMDVTWTVAGNSQLRKEADFVMEAGTHGVQVHIKGPDHEKTLGMQLTVAEKPVEPEQPKPPAPPLPPPTEDTPPSFSWTSTRNQFQFSLQWDQTPSKVLWNFGDGTSSDKLEGKHLYAQVGDYEVTLIAKAGNQTWEIKKTVTVSDVALNILADSTDHVVDFTFYWSHTDGSFLWDFGDGNTSAEAYPTHAYGSPGPFTVTLTAQNGALNEQDTHTIQLYGTPLTLEASVNSVQVDFSYDWFWTPDTILWEFGDGQTSTEPAPHHTYLDEGTYTAKLTAKDGSVTQSVEVEINVVGAPLVMDLVQTDNAVDLSFTWGWPADSILWDFGEGNTSSDADTSFTYLFEGTYTITLTTTFETKVESVSQEVTIVIPLTILPTATGPNVEFDFSWSTTPDRVDWDFGDGATSTLFQPSHTYPYELTYTVSLTVYKGAVSQSTTEDITITGVPLDISTTITRNSVDFAYVWASNSPDRQTWDFGDGQTSTAVAPTNVFDAVGTYTVTLTVEEDTALFGTVSQTTTISLDIIDRPLEILYTQTANSVDFSFKWRDPNPPTVVWDFGDSTQDFTVAPTHVYGFTAVFTVTLDVTDATGSEQATVDITVTIIPGGSLCGDEVVLDSVTSGTDVWDETLAFGAFKEGGRLIVVWRTATDEAATIEIWDGTAWESFTEPLAGPVHAYGADYPVGSEVCFRLPDGQPHLVDMRNAVNNLDGGAYTYNFAAYAPGVVSPDLLRDGHNEYAEMMHNAADGFFRPGFTLVAQDIVKFDQVGSMATSGASTCAGGPYGTFSESDCPMFDQIYALATEPGNGGFTSLGGVSQPDGMIFVDGSGFANGENTPEAATNMAFVTTHELGHYALYMTDKYIPTSGGLLPTPPAYSCETTIMGASRIPREFDDAGTNQCPADDYNVGGVPFLPGVDPSDPTSGPSFPQGPPGNPSWQEMIGAYPAIPDRFTAPLPSDGTTGGRYVLHLV